MKVTWELTLDMEGVEETLIVAVADGAGYVVKELPLMQCSVCEEPECGSSCPGEGGSEEEVRINLQRRYGYNGFIRGLQSLTVAQAVSGCDIGCAENVAALNSVIYSALKIYQPQF